MFKILTLNHIAVAGLERLPRDRYEVASEIAHPDAILVRSHDMHRMAIPETVKAVARAGAGVNNVPVAALTRRGIPVFNAPGANANAVKELVLAGLFLAARNICQAWDYARALEGDDEALHRQVANAAVRLGMEVLGYDPQITIQSAWRLSSKVRQARSMDELVASSDFVTFHVPLTEQTRHMLSRERVGLMREGAVVLNFARPGIVDEEAVLEALDAGRLHAYVCDFPSARNKAHPRVVALPHLGASTREAEENCAVMVVDQLRDYLEHGNIRNAVNFPEVVLPRTEGAVRLGIANANVPNMVGQISTALAQAGLNILDMLNRSKGEVAYTLLDVNREVPPEVVERIRAIDGVLAVRVI